MNKMMRAMLCLALVMVLVLPAAAFAGGRGKANAPGQMRKAPTATTGDESPGTDGDDGAVVVEPKGKKDRSAKEAAKVAKKTAKSKRSREESGSVDASGTPGPKLTGIANAMSRIQANIARAESRIEAGTASKVPSGLLGVLEKFMGWLGLTPDVDPAPDPEPTEEPTSTVEPTGTVEPTATVEPTVTPQPE